MDAKREGVDEEREAAEQRDVTGGWVLRSRNVQHKTFLRRELTETAMPPFSGCTVWKTLLQEQDVTV